MISDKVIIIYACLNVKRSTLKGAIYMKLKISLDEIVYRSNTFT